MVMEVITTLHFEEVLNIIFYYIILEFRRIGFFNYIHFMACVVFILYSEFHV